MSEPESFYAIRRADREPIYGEFSWMACDGPDDWTVAEEEDPIDPTAYEIVRMIVEPVATRTMSPDCTCGHSRISHELDDGACEWDDDECKCSQFVEAPRPLLVESETPDET